MASGNTSRNETDAGMSSGAPELRQPAAPRSSQPLQLESPIERVKSPRARSGNDPYNTSGSFDRTRNWARVGKR
jgi:hypothetical protein